MERAGGNTGPFLLLAKIARVIVTLAQRASLAFVVALAVASQPYDTAVRADDGGSAFRTAGLLRAHWDYPARASIGFGMIAARMPANFECKTACLFRGVTFQAAAGLGAGELAVGYGSLIGETGRGTWLVRRAYVGYGVRAALVRTWGASTPYPAGTTFLGVEAAATVAQFGVRLGLFRQVEQTHGQKDWRLFGGAGWSF